MSCNIVVEDRLFLLLKGFTSQIGKNTPLLTTFTLCSSSIRHEGRALCHYCCSTRDKTACCGLESSTRKGCRSRTASAWEEGCIYLIYKHNPGGFLVCNSSESVFLFFFRLQLEAYEEILFTIGHTWVMSNVNYHLHLLWSTDARMNIYLCTWTLGLCNPSLSPAATLASQTPGARCFSVPSSCYFRRCWAASAQLAALDSSDTSKTRDKNQA